MRITKIGHCCMLIEEKGLKILTDPGNYSTDQDIIKDIDAVLITHEHADHLHIDSLKNVIANAGSKGLVIITNKGVGKQLDAAGIPNYQLIENGQHINFKGVLIEGFGEKHADIYKTVTPVDNTGYFIANRLFYPGDAWVNPKKTVEILALPVAGPWVKISEAIDYALEIKPKVCFPVHDGGLKRPGVVYRLPPTILSPLGINFNIIEEGKSQDF